MKRPRANTHCCWILSSLLLPLLALAGHRAAASPQQKSAAEELLVLPGEVGRPGGRLVMSLRGEPKTLNPLIVADTRSREVIAVMQADLVHINRATQLTEPALAKSWKISPDGLAYTLVLRQGMVLTLAALAVGLPAALAVAKFATSFLYGVHPHDLITFTVVPGFLTGVALLASWIPAQRAAKIDPQEALRYE